MIEAVHSHPWRGLLAALLAATVVVTFAWPLHAQTATVRSGEHDGFSRLVIEIGETRDWRLTGEGRTRTLAFEPRYEAFDTTQVFELIPRTRLASLAASGDLTLELGCDCEVDAYRFSGRYLVVDIADARPRPSAETEPATVRPEAPPLAPPAEAAAPAVLPDLTGVLLDDRTLPDPADLAPQPADPSNIALEDAALIMAEQLARAAASGLLEAAPGRPLTDADPSDRDPPPSEARLAPAGQEASPEPPPPATPALPIRAETAVDAALRRTAGPEPQRPALSCRGAPLDIAGWSHGSGLGPGLGALRLALFDDRDRLVPEAALAVARHYIHHGFGAEAVHWLSQMPDPPRELLAIARLVDGENGPHFPPQPDPFGCDADELLWRFLDGDTLPELSEEQISQVQRAAAALPESLRDHLGPQIARTLAARGHDAAARNIREMLVRGGRLSADRLLHLDLDLGFQPPGGPGATREALALALRDGGADAPLAMAQAMAFDRDIGIPITETRLVAAEAMLRETEAGPDEERLWHEVVLAHAATGNIARVMELLADPDRPDALRQRALSDLFAGRLQAGDTAGLVLLAQAHGSAWDAAGSEAGRTRVAAIAHLREFGLTASAEALRRGQRMLILPARPVPPPTESETAREAWIAENWIQLEGLTTGPHEDLAGRMQRLEEDGDTDATVGPADPDLSALAELVSDTGELRRTLQAVLDDPAPQFRSAAE